MSNTDDFEKIMQSSSRVTQLTRGARMNMLSQRTSVFGYVSLSPCFFHPPHQSRFLVGPRNGLREEVAFKVSQAALSLPDGDVLRRVALRVFPRRTQLRSRKKQLQRLPRLSVKGRQVQWRLAALRHGVHIRSLNSGNESEVLGSLDSLIFI